MQGEDVLEVLVDHEKRKAKTRSLATGSTKKYREGFDKIFGEKKPKGEG